MTDQGASPQVDDLEGLLGRIGEASRDAGDEVTLKSIVEQFGERSFAPLLLLAGLVTLAPVVGDIPGVPTLMALFVLLTAVQLLLRRRHLWLPGFLLRRSVKRKRLDKALGWMRRPARWIDRLLRPRLTLS